MLKIKQINIKISMKYSEIKKLYNMKKTVTVKMKITTILNFQTDLACQNKNKRNTIFKTVYSNLLQKNNLKKVMKFIALNVKSTNYKERKWISTKLLNI